MQAKRVLEVDPLTDLETVLLACVPQPGRNALLDHLQFAKEFSGDLFRRQKNRIGTLDALRRLSAGSERVLDAPR